MKSTYATQSVNFTPHTFDTKVKVSKSIPHIYIEPRAYNDMMILVDEVDNEVGWLGLVEEVHDGYLISEIFLPKQEVHSATTELDEGSIAEIGMQILERPNGMEIVNNIRFWGHSHVNMGTTPSGQDETQMELFRNNGCDWFIRGIANKKGRIEFAIYQYDKDLIYCDVPWSLYVEIDVNRRAELISEIAEKVTEKIYARTWMGNVKNLHVGFAGAQGAYNDQWIADDEDRPTSNFSNNPLMQNVQAVENALIPNQIDIHQWRHK